MTTRFPGYVQPSPGYVPDSPDYPAPPLPAKRLRGEVEVTARVAFGEAPHSPSEMYAYRAPLPIQPFQPVRTVANPEPVLHFLQVASQQPGAVSVLKMDMLKREKMGDLYNRAKMYAALCGDQNPKMMEMHLSEVKVFVRWLLKLYIETNDVKANELRIEIVIMRTVDNEGSRLEKNRNYPDLLRRFFGTSSDSIDELLVVYGRNWLMEEFYSNYRHYYPL